MPHSNLRSNLFNIYDKCILLHSEKRSADVVKYRQNNFIPVYYWSHAIIAQDWFRFAQHMPQQKEVTKSFLIYNRAWGGTREYRLKFTEQLINLGLENHCCMSINPVEPVIGIHYTQHRFSNLNWQPKKILENFFPINNSKSHYSADFDINDYNSTDIEIVLETVFDDTRLHLTEKTLRPIACGQPFILAGTHGSLEYLHSYGFKTFDHIWDESYDQEKNPQHRLTAVVALMKQISEWSPAVRVEKLAKAQSIVAYNKQHFFSDNFFNQINNELINNLNIGLTELEETNTGNRWFNWWSHLRQYPDYLNYCKKIGVTNYISEILELADKYMRK